jgi:hypothetical protein
MTETINGTFTNTDGWGNKLVTVFAKLTPAHNEI